jgi:ubiquinone/menaquinone biosynthesis C-methylase UbiE
MLDVARRSAPGATHRRASLDLLPLSDATFDLVVCGLALTHVRHVSNAIAELARVLRGDGRLLVSDVHPVAVMTGAHAFFRRPSGERCVIRNELHWHGEYVDAFAATNLRVTRCVEPRLTKDTLDA